jgi:hypothetical protein
MALANIIASQIQKVHYEFIEFINTYETSVKSQKCELQALINKWFDPYQKRIVLRNIVPNYDGLLLWKQNQDKPQIIGNTIPFLLQNDGNLLVSHVNFEVVLPTGYTLTNSQEDLLKSIVDKNKLPSKKYRITNG